MLFSTRFRLNTSQVRAVWTSLGYTDTDTVVQERGCDLLH